MDNAADLNFRPLNKENVCPETRSLLITGEAILDAYHDGITQLIITSKRLLLAKSSEGFFNTSAEFVTWPYALIASFDFKSESVSTLTVSFKNGQTFSCRFSRGCNVFRLCRIIGQ